MRHELLVEDWIITSDNSAGIGEKPLDAVTAPDKLTAKYAARVALLEQWAAGSEPLAVLVHNFSGGDQWDRYIDGIEELFKDIGLPAPAISGSSETNMETLQSGLAVTMFGKQKRTAEKTSLSWFTYGAPLVGSDVLEKEEQVADLKKIYSAISGKLIVAVWPVGSKGIAHELSMLFGKDVEAETPLDSKASGGPATCVLIGARPENSSRLKEHFGVFAEPLQLTKKR